MLKSDNEPHPKVAVSLNENNLYSINLVKSKGIVTYLPLPCIPKTRNKAKSQ